MNKRYLLFIAFAIFSLNSLFAQGDPIEKSWDGGAMTNAWEDGDNWNPNGVPGASDDVEIDGMYSVIFSSTSAIESIVMGGGASLTIAASSTLSVSGHGNDGIELNNSGTNLTVNGTLNISNQGASGIDVNKFCSLTVASSGVISVNNVLGDGIELSDEMSNAGTISISNHGKVGIFGGDNAPNNTPISNTGSITITGGFYGIDLSNKFIMTNDGSITLSNASTALIDDGTNLDHYGTLKGDGLVLNGDGNDVIFKSGSIIAPGTSTGTLTFYEEVNFTDVTLNMEINGAMDFDKIIVNSGNVTLSNTTLNITGSYMPVGGEEFMLFEKESAGPIGGEFNGLPDGFMFPFNGAVFTISYNGGVDGNDMVMINNAPLPIELIDFNAQPMEDEVKLVWTTATETNNDFFTIERSIDGRNFEAIATVLGSGNSTEILKYNYIDKNPERGVSYYRLKQTDFDGQFSYSDLKTVEFEDVDFIKIYPTVANEILTIESMNDLNSDLTINVRDLNGRKCKSFTLPEKTTKKEISINDLNPGTYFITIYSSSDIWTYKIIKL